MTKAKLFKLLNDVPDDCIVHVEVTDENSNPTLMEIHSVVVENTADDEIFAVIRL